MSSKLKTKIKVRVPHRNQKTPNIFAIFPTFFMISYQFKENLNFFLIISNFIFDYDLNEN